VTLQVEYRNRELSVRLAGEVDAETLLENLSSHLQLARERSALRLDLSGVKAFNDLAHSALVVLLRTKCGRFARVTLSGLRSGPHGSSWITGGRDLLGNGWEGSFTDDGMCFNRLADADNRRA
jgi:ABC-type transporter Mla MlaB component